MIKLKKAVGRYFPKGIRLFSVFAALSLLLGLGMLFLTVVPTDFGLIKVLLTDIGVILLNCLPLLCIMTFFYCIINRVWISFLITAVLAFVIAEINRFKITFRGDPFIFEDILLISEAEDMLGKYKLFLDGATAAAVLFIAALTVGAFFLFKQRIKNKPVRAAGSVISAAVLVLFCNLFCFSEKIYKPEFHGEFGSRWKDSAVYSSGGVIYSFIKSIPNAFLLPPEDYESEKAEKIYQGFEETPLSDENRVNIISVMFEAYNDLSRFDCIDFETGPYESFHKLQADSYSGSLYTDIFAGGTVKTERSFLTGYSDIRLKNKCGESFVRYFKRQGYVTEAMHPGYGWFYERDEKNILLGFDSFKCYENTFKNIDESRLTAEKYQGMLGNIDFVDYITSSCDSCIAENKKYFNFSVTYENHGPYPKTATTDKTFAVRKNNYNTEDYNILNNYLSGIYNTDKAIQRLRDYADSSSEPIVLILFGDHNPWLGDNNTVYNMLGIDLDLGSAEGGKNYYETPYLFYANEAARAKMGKSFKGQGNTVSPMFLMSEYFEYIGENGSAYLSYLQSVKKETDVINGIYTKRNGEFVFTSDLANDSSLAEIKCMEYYVKSIRTD